MESSCALTHRRPSGCAQSQEQSGQRYATKLRRLKNYGLFGCSGNSDDIEAFTDHFERTFRPSKEMEDSLDSVVRAWVRKKADREKRMHVSLNDFGNIDGIFGIYDSFNAGQPRLFSINPPNEVKEITASYSDSGSGSIFSSFLFIAANEALGKLQLDWIELNSSPVLKFCVIVMNLTSQYDLTSGGEPLFGRCIENRVEIISTQDIFRNPNRFYLPSLLEELIETFPDRKLSALKRIYIDEGVQNALLKRLKDLTSGTSQ